jgi:hypothetical protein
MPFKIGTADLVEEWILGWNSTLFAFRLLFEGELLLKLQGCVG